MDFNDDLRGSCGSLFIHSYIFCSYNLWCFFNLMTEPIELSNNNLSLASWFKYHWRTESVGHSFISFLCGQWSRWIKFHGQWNAERVLLQGIITAAVAMYYIERYCLVFSRQAIVLKLPNRIQINPKCAECRDWFFIQRIRLRTLNSTS